jgi:hypothetical protein
MRERLDIRIDAELREWLVATAESESRTMTHIVERALCVERLNGDKVGKPVDVRPKPVAKPTAEPVATVVHDLGQGHETAADTAGERPRCDTCTRLGPPKSHACKKCGHRKATR